MDTIEFWHWWIAAAVLGALETLAPGAIFIWLANAAVLVGFLLLLLPSLSWQVQVLAFSVLSLASVTAFRALFRRRTVESDDPTLNRRGAQYVGRLLVLEAPIVNGRGRARVDDSVWTVEGDDLPAGATVRVVGTDGIRLKVEKAPSGAGTRL